jgi:hypothetical protein
MNNCASKLLNNRHVSDNKDRRLRREDSLDLQGAESVWMGKQPLLLGPRLRRERDPPLPPQHHLPQWGVLLCLCCQPYPCYLF